MGKGAVSILLALSWCSFAPLSSPNLWASVAPTGLFENHADVGSVLHPGPLQYRDEKGAATHEIQTHEIQANIAGSGRLRIEKRGNFVYLSLGDGGKELHYSGAAMRVALQGLSLIHI